MECSTLTSRHGSHYEAPIRCGNHGIEKTLTAYGRTSGMVRLELSYKI